MLGGADLLAKTTAPATNEDVVLANEPPSPRLTDGRRADVRRKKPAGRGSGRTHGGDRPARLVGGLRRPRKVLYWVSLG